MLPDVLLTELVYLLQECRAG